MLGVVITFAACAAVYIGFMVVLIIRGGRKHADAYLVAASAFTALWASTMAIHWASPDEATQAFTFAARVLEGMASISWVLFVAEIALSARQDKGRIIRPSIMLACAAVVCLICLCLELAWLLSPPETLPLSIGLLFAARLCLALAGLVAVENLIRNTTEEGFWSVKYLGIGLGGLFAYDFYVYADALLFRNVSAGLLELRGAISVLALPLIVVGASRSLLPDRPIALSHRMAFHSLAILAGGVYLLVMAAAGYYIRQFGGSNSNLFTGLFVFGAVLLLAVIFASHGIRSWLKVWLYKNLFIYKYDYRQEWLQFINTIAVDQSGTNLRMRVIKSIANIVDSTGGVLWKWQSRDQSYAVTEKWNYHSFPTDCSLDSQFVECLSQKGWIINLNDWRSGLNAYDGVRIPEWLRAMPETWILVPLQHGSLVLGVVLLRQPRAARMLNWEDFDLLKTCSRQAAGYLSESIAVQALSENRELEIFNRRFAFVIHDIKTTINQLSLLLKNAEKHGENPAFQKDVLASVRDSVTAMSGVLEQINAERQRVSSVSTIDLATLIERVVGQRVKSGQADIRIECPYKPVNVMGDEHRLTTIVSHLVQNAIDAAGETGYVSIGLHQVNDRVAFEVEDDGHGMTPEFIRDELFQPFKSTKISGYGIGAYQCRELVRELGGRLTVTSAPGEGTLMTVTLPAAPATPSESLAVRAS